MTDKLRFGILAISKKFGLVYKNNLQQSELAGFAQLVVNSEAAITWLSPGLIVSQIDKGNPLARTSMLTYLRGEETLANNIWNARNSPEKLSELLDQSNNPPKTNWVH